MLFWQSVLNQALEQAGYTVDSALTLLDFKQVYFEPKTDNDYFHDYGWGDNTLLVLSCFVSI